MTARCGRSEVGYAMAALLVAVAVMSVVISAALPVWSHLARREREEELIWRGRQYARAIGLFQRKYANTSPPNLDVLVEQRFLRKKYKDPITNDDFLIVTAGSAAATPGASGNGSPSGRGGSPVSSARPIGRASTTPGAINPQAAGGIVGVVSKSAATSIKQYNGRTRYSEWAFVWVPQSPTITPPGGAAVPGGRGSGRGFSNPQVPPTAPPFGPQQSPAGISRGRGPR